MEKRKLVLGLMVFATPFMFAACGNKKTVTCEADDDDNKMSIKLEFDTKKNEFTSGSMTYTMDLSDLDEDEVDEIKDEADQFCEMLESSLGFAEDCKTKVSNKEFKADFKVDADKINEDFDDGDLEEYIEDLEESMDAECKIK